MKLRLARNDEGDAEIFRSFQGEGRNIGRIRTFIRLSGCNLHCRWCDTAYTWNWRGSEWSHERDAPGAPYKFDLAEEMLGMEVEEAVGRVLALPAEGVVVTGGEPMIQAEGVLALAQALKAAKPELLLEMETNGTIAPNAALANLVDLFMVSPKLAHSGNDASRALPADSLRAFAALPQATFKFVAAQPSDIDEIATLAAGLQLRPARIYVMPKGVTSEEVTRHGRAVRDAALAAGFNYTDRLHIHLFGEKRGV